MKVKKVPSYSVGPGISCLPLAWGYLTFLALFALSPAPAGANEALLKQGEEYLDAWRLPQADEIAARLLRENPKSPEALDFTARIRLHQGRYEEALRSAEQALNTESKDERRQALRLLAQQTLDTTKKLKRYESSHFALFLEEQRDGILASYALETLERSRESIGKALGYFPEGKVRVEIAPDVASFNAISTLSVKDIEGTGAVGICKFNKIMTISPRTLMHGYRWLDSLSHEYLHFVIVGLSDNKAPIWLHEGMARFYETAWRRRNPAPDEEDYLTPANQTLLARALEKNQFVGFKKMEPSLIYLETPEEVQLAYAEAASAIDFIHRRKGAPGLRTLLAELKRKPTTEAIEQLFASSFGAFETEWKKFLKEKGLKPIEGSRVRKLKVKTNQKDDEEMVELREIQSVVARNRTHLGDELLGRGRAVAASQEYQRALQASPHSPVILNKLARVLIQRDKYDEALPHLKKARDLEPDHVSTYIQLGRLYHAKKNHPEARAALEEAIQINPFNPLIHRLLSDVYAGLGEQDKSKQARATLDRLMKTK
ncbi:MAG: tetratricopeptide repeat protein [Deltaproteobacteria bacterium]|nr:tetratricopeptide repeat protein [Deltaproteobacteria bacterium]